MIQVIKQGNGFLLQAGALEVFAVPAQGMTVERITYHGVEIIDCDTARAQAGATYAVPVLYPTPNRVRDGRFTFEGKHVAAQTHGAVRHTPFTVENTAAQNGEAVLTAFADFLPGTALYEAFPYASRLSITLRVAQSSITWQYTVTNNGDVVLPYSIALHPFFRKNKGAFYRVAAHSVMQATPEKLPTGELLCAEGERYGVSTLRPIEAAELDDVFCVDPAQMAMFEYPHENLCVTMQASAEFGRCVVYTPAGKPWFCLEPQTSSTDCHNLHTAGYQAAANLQLVAPHTKQSGFVRFCFQQKGE